MSLHIKNLLKSTVLTHFFKKARLVKQTVSGNVDMLWLLIIVSFKERSSEVFMSDKTRSLKILQ